ncbi:MAG: family transcriptional regulator, partial [Rhizobacter sp.]|nr:family transcriptional regulator [Rhizobacter sp.]
QIEELEWTQQQLAHRLGYSLKHTNQLIKGKVALTEDAAIRLYSVLGWSVRFWLMREAQYREHAARLDAAERLASMAPWLDTFAVKDLMDAGVLIKRRLSAKSKPQIVGELLSFFCVASPDQWLGHYGRMEVAFRRSRGSKADVGAISVWLRMGERQVEKWDGPRYDESRFVKALAEIRGLTRLAPEEAQPRLATLLREAGVAFALVPALPRTHVSGAARWLNAQRPMIQLSLYGKLNDRFWFSLFHEAAHILLHGRQKKAVFLDDPSLVELKSVGEKLLSEKSPGAKSPRTTTVEEVSIEEKEADAWAQDFLIAPEAAGALPGLARTRKAVEAFAETIGIHPGIVVGRMQRDKLLGPTALNSLKVSFEIDLRHPG